MGLNMGHKAVFLILLLASAMLLGMAGGASPLSDPLCAGAKGNLQCSGTGSGTTVSCSNGATPVCGTLSATPSCSGSIYTCSDGSNPTCPVQNGLINPDNIIFSGQSGSAQSMLSISLLVMLMMLLVVGLVYGIGYAFKIDKLLRFARNEIGEVVVTALIVLVFIGTFSISSVAIGTQNLFAAGQGTLNNNIFVGDCSLLAGDSFDLIGPLITVEAGNWLLFFAGSMEVSIVPNSFVGVTFAPFLFAVVLLPIVNLLLYGIAGFMMILIASTMFIVMIYSLFPLFLYLGIILRTLPWTRAAGGAFLGMFIAFYVAFPLLLYGMLVGYTPYITVPTLSIQANPITLGASDTITATCVSSADTCEVLMDNGDYVYGNPLAAGAGAATYQLQSSSLSENCYHVEAYDAANGKSSMQTLVVDSASGGSPACGNSQSINGALSSIQSASGTSFSSTSAAATTSIGALIAGTFTNGILNTLIQNMVEPMMYTITSVILSLVITFDFMEVLGDLLGAPSLKSSDTLKRLL